MNSKKFKPLNINTLKNKKTTIISTEKAIEDVTPINWSEDVLLGKKKITICKVN